VGEEEWNTRNALLGYYSTQTASHATLLLTIALLGLALGQLRLQKLTFVLALSILIAAFVRTLMRTFYWGYLASAIIQVADFLGNVDRDDIEKEELDKGFVCPELETYRLHNAAVKWINEKRSWASYFGSLFWLKGALLPLLVFVIAFLFLWFGYVFVFNLGSASDLI
jgi:hypothetical protein